MVYFASLFYIHSIVFDFNFNCKDNTFFFIESQKLILFAVKNVFELLTLYKGRNEGLHRTILNDVFTDILSDRQVRTFISKMEEAGIIQKESAGKYTRYAKTQEFPSFN